MTTLRVGGLTPLTTIDYPGELAAVVFCQGCPWRCRYCQNGSLVSARAETPLAWSGVTDFLKRRRGLLDAVVFSGGEPTLQPGLADAMAEVRELGFKVGLHSAGCYPERLADVLPQVDWLGLDIKALPDDYAALTGVASSGRHAWDSLERALDSVVSLEVRVTLHEALSPRPKLERLLSRLASRGVRRIALQACRTATCLDPTLGASRNMADDPELRASVSAWQDRAVLRA